MHFFDFVHIISLWFKLASFYKMTSQFETGNNESNIDKSTEVTKFSNNLKPNTKERLNNVLNSSEPELNIKDKFENFLKEKNNNVKIRLKKNLNECTSEKWVRAIIYENLWYKIGEYDGENNNYWESRDNQTQSQIEGNKINKWLTKEENDNNENIASDGENFNYWESRGNQTQSQIEGNKINEWLTEEENDEKKINEEILRQQKLNEAIQARQELLNTLSVEDRQALDTKTQEEARKVKENLQIDDATRQELAQKGLDENFIDNYILVKVTLNEVKKDSRFDKNKVDDFSSKVRELDFWFNFNRVKGASLSNLDIFFKSIDNNCNFSDARLNHFSGENISNTRAELFHKTVWNESLRIVKDENMKSDSHKETYDEMFPEEMWEDAMFIKYGQFLEWNLRKYWEQYKDNYPWFMNQLYNLREKASKWEKLTDEENEILSIPSKIKWIKPEMDKNTKNMIEELCIISQIKWLYRCMWEWDKNNFELNKANEIENNNWILTLRGHIDWIDFAIRQNTKNPNSLLQTSKMVKKSPDGESFIIRWKENFEDSNFSLPSQDDIFTSITDTIQSNPTIESFKDQQDYLEKLQTHIMKNIDKKYDKTDYVHHYMTEQVKWEKIMDDVVKTIEKVKGSQLTSTDNSDSNKKLNDFLNLMDFNIRYSSDAEKNKLGHIMDKIKEVTSLAKDKPDNAELNKYRPIIKDHLTGSALQNTSENLNGSATAWQSMFDLFQLYKNSWDSRSDGELRMINCDYLYYDLFTPTNPDQHLWVNIPTIKESPVSGKYIENKEDAENTVDTRLEEIFDKEGI